MVKYLGRCSEADDVGRENKRLGYLLSNKEGRGENWLNNDVIIA
jgi:hypothetical protein